jgi:hypothetical protein
MLEQARELEAILKRRAVNIDEDDGDDNFAGEFWKFIDLDELESWRIKLNPMTASTHFVHRFKNMPTFFPISHDKLIREVLFKNGSTVLVHCETRGDELYIFTICVEYSKSPFYLRRFL